MKLIILLFFVVLLINNCLSYDQNNVILYTNTSIKGEGNITNNYEGLIIYNNSTNGSVEMIIIPENKFSKKN